MLDKLEHSIIIIKNDQIEFVNNSFLVHFQNLISRYNIERKNASISVQKGEQQQEAEETNVPILMRCFKKMKTQESQTPKQVSDFLLVDLFEQANLDKQP